MSFLIRIVLLLTATIVSCGRHRDFTKPIFINEGTVESFKITPVHTFPFGLINGVDYKAYGTFQSHYQKVVQNKYGIFVSFLKEYAADPANSLNDKGTWSIQRSVDGGETFHEIYSTKSHSKAPCLETDSFGNLHIAYTENNWNDLVYSRFDSSSNFSSFSTKKVPNAGAGKFTCAINEEVGLFYVLTWANLVRFKTSDLSVLDNRQFFMSGLHGHPQYPHLSFDRKTKNLLAAWTTVSMEPVNGRNDYQEVRYTFSDDAGTTWLSPETKQNITLPIVVDDTGPSSTALLDVDLTNALNAQSSGIPWFNWLNSCLYDNGYFMFTYLSSGANHSNYKTRFTRASRNSNSLSVSTESLKGDKIELNSNGLFLANQVLPNGNSIIYAVGSTNSFQLAALYSLDHGKTWKDHAIADIDTRQPYAITGYRTVTSDGYIVGEYTSVPLPGESSGEIRFFKIKARTFRF